MRVRTVAVVGSGPNGLTAAAVLARAGLDVTVLEAAEEIGGGARSAELTEPGLIHDVCSAFHPFGLVSPAFASLDLAAHGLRWCHAEFAAAHPLPDGSAAVLGTPTQSAGSLGVDADDWGELMARLGRSRNAVLAAALRPVASVPDSDALRAGLVLARVLGMRGAASGASATTYARRWRAPHAPALLAGLTAHAMRPLSAPGTAAIGLVFALLGSDGGWPAARGGSSAITAALADALRHHGGRIEVGHHVRRRPDADLVLWDTAPTAALAAINAAGVPVVGGVRSAYERWQPGPASFKLDLAVDGGVPWAAPAARRAGTVHVGGTLPEIARAEADVAAGRMPSQPFVLVGQQHLADPTRSTRTDAVVPVWAYAHVPRGFAGDAGAAIVGQIERFAPGFRDRIVAVRTRAPGQMAAENPNLAGGDISGGAMTLRQIVARPRLLRPYRISERDYLCSASTAPGGGVHGMCGWNAAHAALRDLDQS